MNTWTAAVAAWMACAAWIAPQVLGEEPARPPVRTPATTRSGSAQGNDKAPLGSPEFYPSSERPVGWRGDSSGRFPAANPPLEWYRRPKGAFFTIRISAAKPKGAGPEGEPLNMGSLREWMIAGPFTAKDYGSAMEDVTQPNESTVQAAPGENLGGKPWKAVSVSPTNQSNSRGRLVLDFAVAYDQGEKLEWQNHPGSLEPFVAYASTNLFAGEAGKIQLRIDGTKVKAWLNGAEIKVPTQHEGTPTVDLVQGWNRLVLKVASSKKEWLVSVQAMPVPGTVYETKNIVWMAPMPGPSWSSPIVVGPKIFVNADEGTLVCLNKENGQTLWTRSTTFYHAISDEERKKFPDLAPKVQQLDQLMESLPGVLNAGLSPDGSKAEGNGALQSKIKEKLDLENNIRQTMGKADKTYNCWQNDRGWAIATPVSDGKYVYGAYYGGIKGIGASAVACFDLDGKRVWTHFTGQTEVYEHGQHSTPALSGNYLVYLSGHTLIGYEKATGKVLWQKKVPGFGNVEAASPVALKPGGVDMVFIPKIGIYRSADGAELWRSTVKDDTVTPCYVDGLVYGVNYGFSAVLTKEASVYVMQVPPPAGDTVKPQFLVQKPWKDFEIKTKYGTALVASPLYDNGLLYEISEGGSLIVADTKTGNLVYNKVLENLNPRLTWVFVVGVCTGPTLAGKYIHVRDDQAQTLVLQPGPVYKELARNVLWEVNNGRLQEAQSNPWYEGGRMYYRTQGFMYCIGEK
ncbi:MAG: PQQ-binding-like beta-propeller repeat protein [Planctomycetota bacterium]|nr:PQQ-binding-like beta-propeller repeat protein [Planctomycetota bacterium]